MKIAGKGFSRPSPNVRGAANCGERRFIDRQRQPAVAAEASRCVSLDPLGRRP